MLQFVIVLILFIYSFVDSVNPLIVKYLLDTGAAHELKSKSEYTAYDLSSVKK
ncbi:hypothetical protein SMGD1_0179 [Sulfurimonas gotlandica GD1]|uniref:Uncharacterized protein n=1 Tax=Sulfurimonas gotlandica (strain DSM 19862 / JCM 16533 / GD1) TaxID=929558 RepID=B6BLP7_SULGG|nr:hypothetical protein CBGD1_2536 [Sulfurimonas gotlandica GD1]EHP28706.1 hypothetical protein SMGD1_0179 [Sulfurimonas gotlandica GD1]